MMARGESQARTLFGARLRLAVFPLFGDDLGAIPEDVGNRYGPNPLGTFSQALFPLKSCEYSRSHPSSVDQRQ